MMVHAGDDEGRRDAAAYQRAAPMPWASGGFYQAQPTGEHDEVARAQQAARSALLGSHRRHRLRRRSRRRLCVWGVIAYVSSPHPARGWLPVRGCRADIHVCRCPSRQSVMPPDPLPTWQRGMRAAGSRFVVDGGARPAPTYPQWGGLLPEGTGCPEHDGVPNTAGAGRGAPVSFRAGPRSMTTCPYPAHDGGPQAAHASRAPCRACGARTPSE